MRLDRERIDDLVHGPRPVRRGLVLLTLAVSLVAVSGAASVWRLGYVVPQDLFHHPVRHPLIASVLLAWSLYLLVDNDYLRPLAIMGVITVACLWYVGMTQVTQHHSAPEVTRPAHDAPYEARADQLLLTFDPTWRVVVRERDGILSREWDLGCVSSRYDRLRWIGPDLLDLGNGHRVRVDPQTGKPLPGQDLSNACS